MPGETVRIPAAEIPAGVLGFFSVYDPKTDSQLLMTASRGDAPNHLNFVSTALTGGLGLQYFTLDAPAEGNRKWGQIYFSECAHGPMSR